MDRPRGYQVRSGGFRECLKWIEAGESADVSLAFFRDNRLIGEIKLYDLDLAGQVVDEYMTGGFTPTMFISLDTTMEQWCQQIEDAYAGVLTGLEEEEDTDAGSQ